MKPYFQNQQVTLYHGDCREVLSCLPVDAADLIITDPPYGVDYKSTGHRSRPLPTHGIANDDGTFDVIGCIKESLRVLRAGRHLYVFGKFNLAEIEQIGGITELIWDKQITGMGDVGCVWGISHEYINFGINGKRLGKAVKNAGNLSGRLRRESVLRFQRLNASGVALHPTEKPILLLRELIESSSQIGETVLDYFAGTGSTLFAAWLEGRKSIGIEIEERYCEIAARRFETMPLLREAV